MQKTACIKYVKKTIFIFNSIPQLKNQCCKIRRMQIIHNKIVCNLNFTRYFLYKYKMIVYVQLTSRAKKKMSIKFITKLKRFGKDNTGV